MRYRTLVAKRCLHRVPAELVDDDRLQRELTFSNPKFFQQRSSGVPVTEPEYIKLWKRKEDFYYVPRNYDIPWISRCPLPVKDLRAPTPAVETPSHSITLRNHVQLEASVALQDGLYDKVISLSCGSGKTVVSLHAAAEGHRFPLLVIVHTNALMDQWRKEIARWYNLRPEEVGHVQQGVQNWRGYRVVVAMLHTVVYRRKKLPTDFFQYFKTVIFDECHRMGSVILGKAASIIPAERWGLSATVAREDGMERAYQMHLGSVVYKHLEQPLKPEVYFVPTGIRVDMGKYLRRGHVQLAKLYTDLSCHAERNALLGKYVRGFANKGRTILVLGERVSQLHELHAKLRRQGVDSAVHVGAMDKESRREALTHQVVLATQHLAREGLDRPEFDTLLIFLPFGAKGRLQQSIGRILRLHDGKKAPLVCIFVDDISVLASLARKLAGHLQDMGFAFFEVKRRASLGESAQTRFSTRSILDPRGKAGTRVGAGEWWSFRATQNGYTGPGPRPTLGLGESAGKSEKLTQLPLFPRGS